MMKSAQRGQTHIEYILIITVVLAMVIAAMKIVRNRIMEGSGQCDNPEINSIACQIERAVTFGNNFKFFTIRR